MRQYEVSRSAKNSKIVYDTVIEICLKTKYKFLLAATFTRPASAAG
jgi:hypothetical protein